MSQNRPSEEVCRKCSTHYKKGMTKQDLIKLTGYSYSSVYGWYKYTGKIVNDAVTTKNNREALFEKLYHPEIDINELMKLSGSGRTTVQQWLSNRKKNGPDSTHGIDRFKGYRKLFNEYYKEGMSIGELRSLTGAPYAFTYQWLNQNK